MSYADNYFPDPNDGFRDSRLKSGSGRICGFEVTYKYYESDRYRTIRVHSITFDNLAQSLVKRINAAECEFIYHMTEGVADDLDMSLDDENNEPSLYGHRDEYIRGVSA
jgi:hypothetical protein